MNSGNSLRAFILAAAGLGLLVFACVGFYQFGTPGGASNGVGLIINVLALLIGGGSLWYAYEGRERPPNPIKPIPWVELHGGMEASDFLNWRTRLSPLVGRDKEKADLLEWANDGGGVQVRFLSGAGGAGKSRLACEVADTLQRDGWQAGEAADNAAELLPKANHKRLFLIVDYPEDDPEAAKALLLALVALPAEAGPVRALFVSRYSRERWEEEFHQIDSRLVSVRSSRQPLTLLRLTEDQAVEVFRNAVARCAGASGKQAPEVPENEVREWLGKGPDRDLFHLPLFVSAAAVHCVLDDAHAVDLSAAQVMTALVKRETRRMRGAGREAGATGENPLVERLVALATVRGGLDVATLRKLSNDSPAGLTFPGDVIAWAKRLDWWIEGARALQPLRPDALGAALVFEVFRQSPEDAPEWLWAVLGEIPEEDRSNWLAAAERIDYDVRRIYGQSESRFAGWLAEMVGGELERARKLDYVTTDFRTGGTVLLSLAIEASLLEDPELPGEERARHLGNWSNRLSDAGRGEEALAASEEAVAIHRRLAERLPERYEPDLATSLNNWSISLSDAGRGEDALAAIEEAVAIRRRLAERLPERYEPDLASSLNNWSNRLSDAGRGEDALAAIEEAVAIYRRLAERLPERYEPDLAASLNNWSGDLSDAGRGEDALAAIEEAVAIYRRLAERLPERFEPDLAMSLNNWSNHLSDAGRGEDALAAIEEAVAIRRRLAERLPERYEPDLAASLNNWSNSLSDAGRGEGALVAIEEAVAIRRRLAERLPERYEPALALSLNNWSNRLSDAGRIDDALAASEEAVAIYRRLAERLPERFEPDLALSLCVMGRLRESSGDLGSAVQCFEEAVNLFRKHQTRAPGYVGRYLPSAERDLERLRGKLGDE